MNLKFYDAFGFMRHILRKLISAHFKQVYELCPES